MDWNESTHTGRQTEVVRFVAPARMIEHPGKNNGRTWEHDEVVVKCTRERRHGDAWGEWTTTVYGHARNVLKSGGLGQVQDARTLTSSYGGLYIPDRHELAEWCRETVQPILDAAIAERDAVAWE